MGARPSSAVLGRCGVASSLGRFSARTLIGRHGDSVANRFGGIAVADILEEENRLEPSGRRIGVPMDLNGDKPMVDCDSPSSPLNSGFCIECISAVKSRLMLAWIKGVPRLGESINRYAFANRSNIGALIALPSDLVGERMDDLNVELGAAGVGGGSTSFDSVDDVVVETSSRDGFVHLSIT
jgi:hypothetical protein